MTNIQRLKEFKKVSFLSRLYYKWFETIFYNIYQYSWVYRIRWFVTHWWRKDNWIKTNLPIGYHDKVHLMEDGLFSLVENYISRNGEDAPYYIILEEDIIRKISGILHFYRIDKPEKEARIDFLTDDIYKDYEMKFIPIPGKDTSEIKMEYHGSYSEDEISEMREEIKRLEKEISDETKKWLKVVIDIREYLWT